MKISKAIVSSNRNPKYRDFWPLVSQAWRNLGIEPVLIYTDNDDFECEGSYGEVIRIFVDGVDTVFASQTVRLLAPALFPDEVSITSDIDCMPLSKSYFQRHINQIHDDKFVVYRSSGATPGNQMAMGYNAAKGKTWAEIFDVHTLDECRNKLEEWSPGGGGRVWNSDQILLKRYVDKFREKEPERVVQLNDYLTGFYRLDRNSVPNIWKSVVSRVMRGSMRRLTYSVTKVGGYDTCDLLDGWLWRIGISRPSWVHDGLEPDRVFRKNFRLSGHTDYHMPRPYRRHKDTIDKVYELYFGERAGPDY